MVVPQSIITAVSKSISKVHAKSVIKVVSKGVSKEMHTLPLWNPHNK